MVRRVVDEGTISNLFPVNNRTKQACLMATLLFSTVFPAILHDTFKDCDKGVKIWFHKDGSVCNIQRSKAKTCKLLHDLLYFLVLTN